jgi:hypothetical protein
VSAAIKAYAEQQMPGVKVYAQDDEVVRELKASEKDFVAVASWGDLKRSMPPEAMQILMEHGAGQSYKGTDCPSYVGGTGNHGYVSLYLAPNQYAARIHRDRHPSVPVKVVGCPKLDKWHARECKHHKKPVICISFHWDCRVVEETRSSFPHFKAGLAELKAAFPNVIGHAHPRIMKDIRPVYESLGIKVVENFNEVMEKADVYAVDNSSTLFEFASTGRPVVVLNAPWYRKNVTHGLRFWECADVGVQCDHPRSLVACFKKAIKDAPEQKQCREKAISVVYAYSDGKAADRAAAAIVETASQPDVEPVTFCCEKHRQLYIYNLNVKFVDGRYVAKNIFQIRALRQIAEKQILPISEEGK